MGDTYRPGEDHRNNKNNRNRSGGGGGNRNRNRGPRKNSNRRPAPPKKKTFLQKILGFFGIGKTEEKPSGRGGPKKSGQKRDRKPRDQKPVEVTSGRLFVGNLNYDVDDAALGEHFKAAGTVKSAEVVTNPHTNKSKGFAFVEMGSLEEAKKAVELLHEKDFLGRKLLISGAKSDGKKTGGNRGGDRSDRPQRDNRERGGGSRGGDRRDRGPKGGGGRDGRRGGRGGKPQGEARVYEAVKPIEIEQVSGPGLALSGLADGFSDEDIIDLFEGIGTVSKSEIGEGTAKIEMASAEDAQKAVELLHAKTFMGKRLSVKGGDVEISESAPAAEPEPAAEKEEAPATAEEETPSPEPATEEPVSATEDSPIEENAAEESSSEEEPKE